MEEPRRQIWVHVGMLVVGDANQIEAVINGDANMLRNLIEDEHFFVDGNSYIPESCIEEYNNDYGTDHEIKDIEFDL